VQPVASRYTDYAVVKTENVGMGETKICKNEPETSPYVCRDQFKGLTGELLKLEDLSASREKFAKYIQHGKLFRTNITEEMEYTFHAQYTFSAFSK
jgi:hypothetical protein